MGSGLFQSMAKTLDEALSLVTAWSAAHPDLPWILGTGWNQVNELVKLGDIAATADP